MCPTWILLQLLPLPPWEYQPKAESQTPRFYVPIFHSVLTLWDSTWLRQSLSIEPQNLALMLEILGHGVVDWHSAQAEANFQTSLDPKHQLTSAMHWAVNPIEWELVPQENTLTVGQLRTWFMVLQIINRFQSICTMQSRPHVIMWTSVGT